MEETMKMLKQKARETWDGQTGEQRATRLESFLRELLPNWANVLGLTEPEILAAIESKRTYSAVNYYQRANFPLLEHVTVYETQAAMQSAIPSMRFRCPCCEQVSTDPYVCNSGANKKGSEDVCDWKSYGLFSNFGKGFRFTIREGFLEKPFVDECFMPLDLEPATTDQLGEG